MMQKAKKKEAIEKVRGVFEGYIQASPYMELLWSDKLGYVLMLIDSKTSEIVENRVVTDAESLCRYLIGEIAQKALEIMGKDHDACELSPREHDEIRKELKPYMEQLPEYGYLLRKHFKPPSEMGRTE